MNHPTNSPEEFFEVDSALLSEVGEKLVTSPHVALAELVKNAYDADATEVTITITPDADAKIGPRVDIVDNGQGMTRDEVHRYWMRIGTNNKSQNSVSPRFGRPRSGAKGIGRFACRRLGRVLDMTTWAKIPKGTPASDGAKKQKTTLHFDWLAFVPGTPVSSTPVITSSELTAETRTGLTLSMTGAPINEWTALGMSYLQRQLAVMAANHGTHRPGFKEDPGFTVTLVAPGLTKDDKIVDIRSRLIDAGWGTISAHVDDNGYAVCTLQAKGLKERSITSKKTFNKIKGTSLKLGIFVADRDQMRNLNLVSKYNMTEITRDWGGVQVRHRGFRVYPYGDINDDWLDIERDKARRLGRPTNEQIFNVASVLDGVDASRSLLNLLSMRNFLGSVEINSDNGHLESKADRMGFVANEAFEELKEFSRFAIDWSMVMRDYWIQQTEEDERDKIRAKIERDHGKKFAVTDSPKEAIKVMRNTLKVLAAESPVRQQKNVSLLHDLTKFLDHSLQFASRDLLRLRLIASTSTLTLLFAHEVKSLAGIFSSISQEIEEIAPSVPGPKRARLRVLGNEVQESQRSLKELLDLTHAMGVMDRDAGPINIDLREACDRAVSRFSRLTTRYHIDVQTSKVPEGMQVGPMLEGELLAIIINVLSNSLKAVIAGGDERIVELSAAQTGKLVTLDIRDTGAGLDPEHHEQVFTPMQADPSGQFYDRLLAELNPEDSLLLGNGTGLGLSIVRGILRARKGDAIILKPNSGWNFHLRMQLP